MTPTRGLYLSTFVQLCRRWSCVFSFEFKVISSGLQGFFDCKRFCAEPIFSQPGQRRTTIIQLKRLGWNVWIFHTIHVDSDIDVMQQITLKFAFSQKGAALEHNSIPIYDFSIGSEVFVSCIRHYAFDAFRRSRFIQKTQAGKVIAYERWAYSLFPRPWYQMWYQRMRARTLRTQLTPTTTMYQTWSPDSACHVCAYATNQANSHRDHWISLVWSRWEPKCSLRLQERGEEISLRYQGVLLDDGRTISGTWLCTKSLT